MKKVTFYIGLNDKDSKIQEIDTQNARNTIENIFIENCDGCTIYTAKGIYTHENGVKVVENTICVDVFDMDDKDVFYIAEYLKKAINQESIAVNVQEINCMFI